MQRALFFAAVALGIVGTARIAAAQSSSAQVRHTPAAETAADETSLQEKLNQRIEVDYVELPLKDVIMDLAQKTGIPILYMAKKLEEASVSPDTPVTKTLRMIRLRTVLELLLADLELTYVEKDGTLLITTPEDAESRLVTRVYDCRDLLAMPAPEVPKSAAPIAAPGAPAGTARGEAASSSADRGPASGGGRGVGGGFGSNLAATRKPTTELEKRSLELLEVITATIKPDSWDDVGGPGAIEFYNGLFVVSQTDNVHQDVEHLLGMLRKAAGLTGDSEAKTFR